MSRDPNTWYNPQDFNIRHDVPAENGNQKIRPTQNFVGRLLFEQQSQADF